MRFRRAFAGSTIWLARLTVFSLPPLRVMTENEALKHLRNVLRAKNPDLERLVHSTEQQVLGQATARGRTYDPSIASHLARTFLELTRDTVNSALEEAKRIFLMPGMPVDDSTKAGVKAIFADLENELMRLAQQSLDRLAANFPATPRLRSLASEIEPVTGALSSEIDLLFHAANVSRERQVVLLAGQTLNANLVLREIFESAQSSIDIADPYLGSRLFALLTAKTKASGGSHPIRQH
jgi:hypothetical protein